MWLWKCIHFMVQIFHGEGKVAKKMVHTFNSIDDWNLCGLFSYRYIITLKPCSRHVIFCGTVIPAMQLAAFIDNGNQIENRHLVSVETFLLRHLGHFVMTWEGFPHAYSLSTLTYYTSWICITPHEYVKLDFFSVEIHRRLYSCWQQLNVYNLPILAVMTI